MVNAVLTTSESSAYDDQIEERYHFPATYLKQAQVAIGDFILYYEPRRTTGPHSATGRQSYFAMARLTAIEADTRSPSHYYARISEFMEFDRAVPFREGGHYYESILRKFAAIVQAGFATELEPWEAATTSEMPFEMDQVAESPPEYVPRAIVQHVLNRKFRDVRFRRHVRSAYDKTCAVTGLRLINGGGRPEVEAAHIRPVENDGPDTVRNGIALTGTAHWLFDRGLMSFSDNYDILLSPHGVPDGLDKLIRPERKLIIPDNPAWRPHPIYLQWHRKEKFKY